MALAFSRLFSLALPSWEHLNLRQHISCCVYFNNFQCDYIFFYIKTNTLPKVQMGGCLFGINHGNDWNFSFGGNESSLKVFTLVTTI
jgi:hypothetical protein